MRVLLGLGIVLATVFPASSTQLPEECTLPAAREQALRDNPSAKLYGETGGWFAELGNLRCALAAFEQAVRLDPHSGEAHYNLGAAEVRAGQLPEGAAELRLAVHYKPEMTMARSSLGSVLLDMGSPRATFACTLAWAQSARWT